MVADKISLSVEIKCPNCGRHLDKFNVIGEMATSRKCKNCKNNIFTQIVDNKIVINAIDTKENAKDLLTPYRFSSSQRAKTRP
ncbi:hypothetical protein K5I29_04175 [Flavobacterium agricola]|uniref:Mu-like prophage protein Com n=1 Tax=Flavobacterium agricola TaxID=2870839 RepID=A0ABY6M0M7_9FLAO|nr:hypothetical protein [Flavobacterium agricola]UYW02105.1 hypothetical protein K5I29_04175 [Flavobacterium agricola]